MRPRRPSARELFPLACLVLLAACPGALAAQLQIKAVELAVPDKADLPVVRGLMQTRPGSPYNPRAIAGDLRRLQMLGCVAAKLDLAFQSDHAAISLTVSRAGKPVQPELVSIEMTGGVPGINEACRALLSQRPSILFRRCPLEYYSLLLDAQTAEREYAARGYLDARVSRVTVNVDGKSARAEIHVTPGPRFVLHKVTVGGNREIKAAELTEALKLPNAPPWTNTLRMEIVDRATHFCRERGYLDTRVEAEPKKQPNGTVDLRLKLTEGDRCVLNNVVVRGAQEHKDQVAKLITLRKGKPVRQSDIEALRRAIEDIGAFTDIEMLFVPLREKPAGRRDLVIRLTKIDLGREIGAAEKLYYEMVQRVIRLYNRDGRELRAVEVTGFFTTAEGRVDVDARIARPDFARLTLRRPGKAPAPDFTFLRSGGTTTVHCSTMKGSVPIPAALALKIALLPSDFDRGRPARIQFAPGLASGKAAADMLALGGRCPPVAAYFTEQAARFGRVPPKLAADGTLILPDTDGGRLKITLNASKLPVRVIRQDKDGATTARFDVKLDAPGDKTELVQVPGLDSAADGFGLLAPALLGLGMPQVAADFANKGVDKYPKSAACRAARGLIRLTTGPPEPGLADLRKAAELSDHPAYALLLTETLIRGKRFAEAKAVCEKVIMKAAKPKTEKLEPADIILGMSLSLRAAFGTMMSGRDDYGRRAVIDCALAHVGLREYAHAAALVKKLLATKADDAQAAELLARAQLSLGRPKAALDALAKFDADTSKPQLRTYAALAHHALGNDDKAAAALGAAIKKTPALRNLIFLQQQAGEIHPRFKGTPAKTALAKLFSRAVMGMPGPDRKARLAAIVNDSFVLKADLDALTAQLARRANLRNVPPEKIRAAALNQIIEDMLVIRWAMWRGITVPDEDVRRTMRDEMTRLGAADIEDYKKLLKERGADFATRPAEIRDSLLKRGAFSVVLSGKILVRPADIRAEYKKNIDEFKVPPTARLRMITLEFARFRKKEEAERLAAALLRRLKAKPESFAELAREYSHDANAERGGLWENVTKSSLIDPLDKVVFGLKPGRTSGVVKTRFGCHIVRVEKIAPERTRPLEEAAAKIARSLQEARSRAEVAAWLERLKAESYIETFGE